MNIKDIDVVKSAITQKIDDVTCLECCKCYTAPETAACGHSLCHLCWITRRTCPYCAEPFDRRFLKYNRTLQDQTENVHALGKAFEKVFNVQLDEFLLDTGEVESENDPHKNVKDCLKSSQKYLFAPVQSSEPLTQEMQHSKDIENNIVGPMDIEHFYIDDDKEYTVSNPRRSSRIRNSKHTDINDKTNANNTLEKQGSKDSNREVNKKSNKRKKNWNSVKNLRKKFCKINRNKIKFSIQMWKKAQSTSKFNVLPLESSPEVCNIDVNTTSNFNNKKQTVKHIVQHNKNKQHNNDENRNVCEEEPLQKPASNQEHDIDSTETNIETMASSKSKQIDAHNVIERTVRLPFHKRNALHPNSKKTNTVNTINHIVDSNSTANDHIEMTIKVGNTITNIVIKNKNDVKLKVNTDRETQTSLASHDVIVNNKAPSALNATQNILINLGDSRKAGVEIPPKTNIRPEQYTTVTASVRSLSGNKNTDSAYTATSQFKITETVEKNLSNIMEYAEVGEASKSKSTPTLGKQPSPNKNTDKNKNTKNPESTKSETELLNFLSFLGTESDKESDVNLMKHTEYARSEILHCTVKAKNKSKKSTKKRYRDNNDDILPKPKKTKGEKSVIVAKNYALDANNTKQNRSESDSMNFDTVMGTELANIDDIEEIQQTRNIDQNNVLNDHNKDIERTQNDNINDAQDEVIPGTNEINSSVPIINISNQKEGENILHEDNNEGPNEKVPALNTEHFPTHTVSCNIELTALQANDDLEMMYDDSDKSVVEETPQKTTSFSKTKQISSRAIKEVNQSQMIELSEQRVVSNKIALESPNMKSVINELSKDSNTSYNANEWLDKITNETPLTINKFVENIRHNSTPNVYDPEKTHSPTNAVAKTNLEKETTSKASEKMSTAAARYLEIRSVELKTKKYRMACSCLTPRKITKVKQLCARQKWSYTDKYDKGLTHLVVAVDENNTSQRTVKFMCALASAKWIVSFEWVEECLRTNHIVDEEYFEVFDSSGEPGPRRSRLTSEKLFQGITFYCMEPFISLEAVTLKDILEAAGGRVVKELEEIEVTNTNSSPSLLLAEPENSHNDQFTYLALESNIVPMNYEWVLNCLGSYSLHSIPDLLLCPMDCLPNATKNWPQKLLVQNE